MSLFGPHCVMEIFFSNLYHTCMNAPPEYNLDTIRYAVDEGTWERAVALYEGGKVKDVKELRDGYAARVSGGSVYQVNVSRKHVDRGDCDCYVGKNGELCKHMIAVAIYAVRGGEPLSAEDKRHVSEVVFSGATGDISDDALKEAKQHITAGMRCIKAYDGPSRTWFAYQGKLDEGCMRIAEAVSVLPAHEKTAKLLLDTLLKLDKKLSTGGVDDSDGVVGNCMNGIVDVLLAFAAAEPACVRAFRILEKSEACFEWDKPLIAMYTTYVEKERDKGV
jgi:hypothetical protein